MYVRTLIFYLFSHSAAERGESRFSNLVHVAHTQDAERGSNKATAVAARLLAIRVVSRARTERNMNSGSKVISLNNAR